MFGRIALTVFVVALLVGGYFTGMDALHRYSEAKKREIEKEFNKNYDAGVMKMSIFDHDITFTPEEVDRALKAAEGASKDFNEAAKYGTVGPILADAEEKIQFYRDLKDQLLANKIKEKITGPLDDINGEISKTTARISDR